jgi:hypothetical protein
MAGQRTSFGKLQRDRAKKEKAAAKRERRQERGADPERPDASPDPAPGGPGGELSADELLARIESIHQRFDAGMISYDDFEQEKDDLLGRLQID